MQDGGPQRGRETTRDRPRPPRRGAGRVRRARGHPDPERDHTEESERRTTLERELGTLRATPSMRSPSCGSPPSATRGAAVADRGRETANSARRRRATPGAAPGLPRPRPPSCVTGPLETELATTDPRTTVRRQLRVPRPADTDDLRQRTGPRRPPARPRPAGVRRPASGLAAERAWLRSRAAELRGRRLPGRAEQDATLVRPQAEHEPAGAARRPHARRAAS